MWSPLPQDQVVKEVDPSVLKGQWYVVSGGSSLETYDCQANWWSSYNDTDNKIQVVDE